MSEGWLSRYRGSGPPVLLAVIGGVLATGSSATAYGAAEIATAVEAAIIGVLALAVVVRSLTLHASDRTAGEKWRIAAWCLVGTLGASLLAGVVVLHAALQDATVADPATLVFILAGMGAIAGLFVGGDQVRAIAAGRSSERREISELLEKREEERLTFLNNLLRHNVLNGMNIVLGYTTALDERIDGHDEYVDRIRSRSESVVELVQNVQVLVRSLSGDLEVGAVDLSETARVQVERARVAHDDTTFHADVEDGVVVATTPFVAAAIENLLTNAAVHNTRADPTVTVRVERAGDQGAVTVVDNGPGIPEDVVSTYFGDHDPNEHFVGDGLGLYLVDELVSTHGGTVEVDARDGTTISLRFPLATDQAIASGHAGHSAAV